MIGEHTVRLRGVFIGMITILLAAGGVGYGEGPYLQLDFADSVYDGVTDTVFATTNPAKLYALVDSTSSKFDLNFLRIRVYT